MARCTGCWPPHAGAAKARPPCCWAGAVSLGLLWGRRAAAAVLCLLFAAAGAAAGRAGVAAALEALTDGDAVGAARWALLVPLAGLLAPLGAALGWPLSRLRGRALLVLVLLALAAGWAATPPLWAAEQGFAAGPAISATVGLPQGQPGPAFSARPLSQIADLEPITDEEPPRWRCAGDVEHWWRTPRVSVVLALPASTSGAELDAWVDALEARRVGRLGLVGRSTDPLPGRLGTWLSWPTVGLLLDRPPKARAGPAFRPRGQLGRAEPRPPATAPAAHSCRTPM